MSRFKRVPQLRGTFEPGDPESGYYNDLTPELGTMSPRQARERVEALGAASGNLTTVAQLGLAAWQRRADDPEWSSVVEAAASVLEAAVEDDGRLLLRTPMTHTYEIDAPWSSAMTQGEAASLFVRAARLDGRSHLLALAARVVQPLFESPLSVSTPEGPVLQEYPTTPPSHVLNGWMYGLWGLYDVALSSAPDDVRERTRAAFDDGARAVAARVDRYETLGWSRYDLYPHPIAHVASPYYHRLHVELLRALDELAPDPRLRAAADRWERSGNRVLPRSVAVARKVAFRLIKPRRARQTRRS